MKNPANSVRITTLVENSVQVRGLRAEHGLAFHLQVGERSLLFDTGPGDLIQENARGLNIALDRVGAVVLSHGHYDHTGGLAGVLAVAPQAQVFLHPGVLQSRYVREANGSFRSLGLPAPSRQALTRAQVISSTTMIEVFDGLYLTGQIPRESSEDVGGAFFLDQTGSAPDPIFDDQALFFQSSAGVVVLLGCGHAGLVNTLRHVQRLTKGQKICALLGGMHLLHASSTRIQATIAALREFGVSTLAPGHCTGLAALASLWSAFPGQCSLCSTASTFAFTT